MPTPIVGVDERHFVVTESAFDTYTTIAATEACPLIKLDLDGGSPEFHKAKEHVGTASLQTEIEGKRKGSWSLEAYVKPAAAGTAPDIFPVIEAALGLAGVVDPGVSVTHGLSGVGTTPRSLQLVKHSGDSHYEIANGSWCEKLEIEAKGNEEAKIMASGGFATKGFVLGDPTTDTTGYATTTTVIGMAAGDGGKVQRGARINFGANTNTGAGYLVTDVDLANETITIDPGIAGSAIPASAVAITPTVPTSQTIGGTIVGGIENTLSIGGTEVGFISAKVSIDTGIHGLDKEANINRANRLARGERVVQIEAEFYMLDEVAQEIGLGWDGTTRAVVLTLIAPNGRQLEVTLGAVRLEVKQVETDEFAEATFKLTGVARQVAAAEDELELVWT